MGPISRIAIESIAARLTPSSGNSFEFLRVPAMSAGVYVLGAGEVDHQSPHDQDELYYVVRGRGSFRSAAGEVPVAPGDVLFVAAHEPHKFVDVEEELLLLVVFAPAKSRPAP